MKDIKEIIASNLVALRKKNNLTQNDLAEKINYSDNAVSRWERAEVTPSIETLQQIAEFFGVPLASMLEDRVVEVSDSFNKKQKINKLAVMLLFISLVWFIATVAFVYGKVIFQLSMWSIFIWAVPASCLIMIPFNENWGKYTYKFIIISVFLWTLLASIFLQFIEYNMWLIFIVGVPVQMALAIWAFIKPKSKK